MFEKITEKCFYGNRDLEIRVPIPTNNIPVAIKFKITFLTKGPQANHRIWSKLIEPQIFRENVIWVRDPHAHWPPFFRPYIRRWIFIALVREACGQIFKKPVSESCDNNEKFCWLTHYRTPIYRSGSPDWALVGKNCTMKKWAKFTQFNYLHDHKPLCSCININK